MTRSLPLSRATVMKFCIMSVASLEYIQNGMLNFAAAHVMGGIGAAPEEFSYAAMAYALCAVLALFNHRWCAERFGSRRFVQLSLVVFAAGALCCACAQTAPGFILGRALQGVGGATFFTAARVEIQRLTGKERMMTLLVFGYSLLLGSALGPLLGGLAIQYASWRWIFWGMAPWLMLAWFASRRLHEATEAEPSHFPGAVLVWLIAAVFLVLFLIQQTPYDYFSHPEQLLLLVFGGLGCGLVFLRRHRRTASDRERWAALVQARYLGGLAFYGVCYFLVAANSYVMPVMVQQALGYDVPTTGGLLAVGYVAGIGFATLYAKMLLSERFRPGLRLAMVAACLLLIGYGYGMTRLSPAASIGQVAALWVLNGGFMSLFISAVAQGTFQDIDAESFPYAYQTKNIVRQISLSAAVAVSTVFLQARNAVHVARLSEGYSWNNPIFVAMLDQWHRALPSLEQGTLLGLLAGELGKQALMVSCLDFFRFETWVGIALMSGIVLQRHFR